MAAHLAYFSMQSDSEVRHLSFHLVAQSHLSSRIGHMSIKTLSLDNEWIVIRLKNEPPKIIWISDSSPSIHPLNGIKKLGGASYYNFTNFINL